MTNATLGQEYKKLVTSLQTVRVQDIKPTVEHTIIEVESNTPVAEALQVMKNNRILAVPVFDKDTGSYLGFLDVLDILFFILQTCSENQNQGKELQWSNWIEDFETLMHRGVRFGIKPVKHVVNMSHADHWFPVYEHGTIFQLVEDIFSKGVHRAPVMDDMNKIVNVITQSDVVRLLVQNDSAWNILGNFSVEQLRLGTDQVISMSVTAQAIHAFYLMFYHKVSAVAIVDQTGALIANLSASDIKGLEPKDIANLVQPCVAFFLAKPGTYKSPITCTKSTKLSTIIHQIVFYRIHRVWIVDDKGVPIGVISLTDIMKLLGNLPQE